MPGEMGFGVKYRRTWATRRSHIAWHLCGPWAWRKLRLGLLLLTMVGGIALCTFGRPLPSPPAVLQPSQIRQQLLGGSKSKRAHLSKVLHLVIPRWRIVGAKAAIPCLGFDSVKIAYVNLLPPHLQAVLGASSQSCQYTYLVVLQATGADTWKYIQTVAVWTKYASPRVSFESLVSPGTKEMIVRNNAIDYGTGIQQVNMTIWKLYPSGLQVIFDEPSRVVFAIPISGTENSEQSEESQFVFVPPSQGGVRTSVKQILQKQTIHDHRDSFTRWWLYIWIPEMHRFQKEPAWR